MVASTEIKYFSSINSGAPQLTGGEWGQIISILDACLVNGFGSKQIQSMTADEKIVTVNFNENHGYLLFQVIKITGANQTEFNGEHRIISLTQTAIQFKIASNASVSLATGTLVASLASAGWDKAFSAQGRAAYQPVNSGIDDPPFFRIVDELDPLYGINYAKFAKVGLVENMADINSMSGLQAPYDSLNPDKNWIATGSGSTVKNGWAKLYYGTFTEVFSSYFEGFAETQAPKLNQKSWTVISGKDFIYILNNVASGSSNYTNILTGFGLCGNDWFLYSKLNPDSASNMTYLYHDLFLTSQRYNDKSSSLIKLLSNIYFGAMALSFCSPENYRDAASSSGYLDISGSEKIMFPVYLIGVTSPDNVGGSLLGEVPCLKWNNTLKMNDMTAFTDNEKMYIHKHCLTSIGMQGSVSFCLGEL